MILEEKIYGIIPYIAPEVLRGNEYTQASDIYSLGIIINEIIFGNRPFNSLPYDEYLAIDICEGLRPNIRNITPKPLRELIQKCWDENPKNRPNTVQICYMLRDFKYMKNENNKEHPYNYRKYTEQYEEHKESSYDLINENTIMIFPPESQEKSKPINVKKLNYSKSSIIYVKTEKVSKSGPDECLDCAIDLDSKLRVNSIHEKWSL
ncbi:kinase-like domain-containing protein [Glomus cerebriforme]|uniref:Kinase-like domain-containing protein n=1 Tax=Glomus cerebriforme TaxID=658196 RepID=A0A397THU0_9GLOM|nr:kinase-like domain-containing protein [Glomus cerebriforme]